MRTMKMALPHGENDSNDDAWDNLCMNPHSQIQENGRERGGHDGSMLGYNEGYNIGRTTAISNGMEIGFIQGVLAYLTDQSTLSALLIEDEKVERAQKSIQNLQIAINEFPSPDVLVPRMPHDRTVLDEANVDDNGDDKNINTNIDISNKLQRIRARFKLLMVQLGLSHVSLKQLMDISICEPVITNSEDTASTSVNLDTHNTSEW